jgi:hypothetical protein
MSRWVNQRHNNKLFARIRTALQMHRLRLAATTLEARKRQGERGVLSSL